MSLGNVWLEQLIHSVRQAIPAESTDLEFEAIRVCTLFGHFQMDLTASHSLDREVFVISDINIGEQIAQLCDSTSLFTVFPIKLNKVLQQITGSFPRYPGMTEDTRASGRL